MLKSRNLMFGILTLVGFQFGIPVETATAQVIPEVTIEGEVEDEKGIPLPNVSVTVENQKISTRTDQSGHYLLRLKSGKYNIRFSYIGFQTKIKSADLSTGSLKGFNLTLSEDKSQLQNVEILGRKERSYRATGSFSGTKTETQLRDIPQAISYVTKEVIEDQQAYRAIDLVKNVSGTNAFSTYDNDIVIRGFRASNSLMNGLRNISNGWSSSLLPYVEKMEVIKGPASALFANTDAGGTVNIITKKPLNEDRKSVMLSTGSYNTTRIAADFTGPIDSSETFLYRLNLAYQNAGSFRDLQGTEDIVIAPSFSFIPNDRTKVNFELIYSRTNGRLDRGQPTFGEAAGLGQASLYTTPISFAIGKDNDFLNETTLFSTISVQHKLSDKISLNASYMKSFWKEDLLEHRTSNSYAVDVNGNEIPTLMGMRTTRRKSLINTDNLTLYGVYTFNTGPVTHNLLLGYDYIQSLRPKDNNSAFNARGYRNAANTGKQSNSYNPANASRYLIVNGMPVPNVPHFDLTNPDYSFSDISNYFSEAEANEFTPTKYYVNGVYVQDQIKWNQVQLLLGLRKEYYTDVLGLNTNEEAKTKESKLLPRIGMVYTPITPLSIYATYTQSYQPQGLSIVSTNGVNGGPFDPMQGTMIEGGLKMDLFEKRLAVNIAAYRIEQSNVLVDALDPENENLLRPVSQRATGIETDIYGSVNRNFSILVNFSYNKAIITESSRATDIGDLMAGAPRSQGNFWAKYTFTGRQTKGIGVALGANYVTKRNTLTESLQLPAYQLVNAALSYTVNKFKMAVNFNNIFNKTHWIGGYDYNRVFPGTPRNYMTSIGYVF